MIKPVIMAIVYGVSTDADSMRKKTSVGIARFSRDASFPDSPKSRCLPDPSGKQSVLIRLRRVSNGFPGVRPRGILLIGDVIVNRVHSVYREP